MDEDALPPASVRRDHFLIALNLPVGKQFTTGDVYPHVYGHRLSDGAKPWPHLRDARSRKWFGLFTADETPIDALVWLIPFDQLAYKAAAGAERYGRNPVRAKGRRRPSRRFARELDSRST